MRALAYIHKTSRRAASSALAVWISLGLAGCSTPNPGNEATDTEPTPAEIDAFRIEQLPSFALCPASLCPAPTAKTQLLVTGAVRSGSTSNTLKAAVSTDRYTVFDVNAAPDSQELAAELTKLAKTNPRASFHWLLPPGKAAASDWIGLSRKSGIREESLTAGHWLSQPLTVDKRMAASDSVTRAQLLAIWQSSLGNRKPSGPKAPADAVAKQVASGPAIQIVRRLVELQSEFDPTITDLYAPGATIVTRKSVGGVIRDEVMSRDQFKSAVWTVFPQAKQSGQQPPAFGPIELISQTDTTATVVTIRQGKHGQAKVTWTLELISGNWKISKEEAMSSTP